MKKTMTLFIALFFVAACEEYADAPDALDASVDAEQAASAISNGTYINSAHNPNVVAVYHGYIRPCSGTLLTRDGWVLTAYHCIYDDDRERLPSEISVSPASNTSPGLYPPADAVHPTYVTGHPTIDAALLYVPDLPAAPTASFSGIWFAPSDALLNKGLSCYGYGMSTDGRNWSAGYLRWGTAMVSSIDDDSYNFSPEIGRSHNKSLL